MVTPPFLKIHQWLPVVVPYNGYQWYQIWYQKLWVNLQEFLLGIVKKFFWGSSRSSFGDCQEVLLGGSSRFSARSGAAMAMYLAGVPVFTIMLLGRWSSDAFLRYIRKQVKEFSSGVSYLMINNGNFFTIQQSSHQDPRAPILPLNTPQRFNNGNNFKGTVGPLASAFV
jgi:hypothetical protein